jgi:hypothetical protein
MEDEMMRRAIAQLKVLNYSAEEICQAAASAENMTFTVLLDWLLKNDKKNTANLSQHEEPRRLRLFASQSDLSQPTALATQHSYQRSNYENRDFYKPSQKTSRRTLQTSTIDVGKFYVPSNIKKSSHLPRNMYFNSSADSLTQLKSRGTQKSTTVDVDVFFTSPSPSTPSMSSQSLTSMSSERQRRSSNLGRFSSSSASIFTTRELFPSPAEKRKSNEADMPTKQIRVEGKRTIDVSSFHEPPKPSNTGMQLSKPSTMNTNLGYLEEFISLRKDVEFVDDFYTPPKKTKNTAQQPQQKKKQQPSISGYVPASMIPRPFPAINSKKAEFEEFVKKENLQIAAPVLMGHMRKAFYPFYTSKESRISTLQKVVPISVELLERMVEIVNSLGIIDIVKNSIKELKDSRELSFYIGISTRDFYNRFSEHRQWHKMLFEKVLLETPNFEDGVLAEFTGITTASVAKNGVMEAGAL